LQTPNDFVTQTPFNFLMVSLIIFSFGPGAFSVDAIIKRFKK
jgi:putative oxidoreductase